MSAEVQGSAGSPSEVKRVDAIKSQTLLVRRATEGAGSEASLDPVRILRRSLKGRYPLLVVLCVALSAAGGAVGWRLTHPLYRSESLLRVKWQSDDPDSAPFDVLMQSQQALITSRRVVDRALATEEWEALHQPVTPEVIQGFANDLGVEVKPRTEFLKITYTDVNPIVASTAVRAVTKAYVEVYKEDEDQSKVKLLSTWSHDREELGTRIRRSQNEIDDLITQFGSSDLGPLHDAAVQRASRIDVTIEDLHVAMTAAEGAAALPSAATSRLAFPSNGIDMTPAMTPEQIAAVDEVMRGYLAEQQRLQGELDTWHAQGFLDSYRNVALVKHSLQKASERVSSYAIEYQTLAQAVRDRTARVANVAPSSSAPREQEPRIVVVGDRSKADMVSLELTKRSAAELRDQDAKLAVLRDKARQEMVTLERARLQVEQVQLHLHADLDALAAIDRKLSALQDQNQMGGRLTVVNAGEIPLSPSRDLRIKLAAAGALAGASLPVLLVSLLAFIFPRYRFAEETVADIAGNAPLLGVLPTLTDSQHELDVDDAMFAAGAAQRVHQIRVMLQVGHAPERCASYLVTSATAGEGKTTLTMAMGLSFAASGMRTLVIDCDLVGQQLTIRSGAANVRGLHEALREGSLRACVRRTDAGLFILPVGKADALDASGVSPAAVKQLLAEARRYFDVILIDSGPILGSVEASVVAQNVDGVILAVSRGRQPLLVDRAIRHIHSMGAPVRGFVFNRADLKDYHQSAYPSSSDRWSSGVRSSSPTGLWRYPNSQFGPLVGAVMASLPACADSSLS